MNKTCSICNVAFEVSKAEIAMHEKFDAEPQSMCFWCIQRQHLAFRNGAKLYRRTCDYSGDAIVSMYAPNAPYKIYKPSVWWGDTWDAVDYGKDYDFTRPFFEQFKALQLAVPRLSLISVNGVNSDYCNMCEGNNNCYLVLGGDFNEDSMYSVFGMRNKSCNGADSCNDCELTFASMNSFDCYGCRYAFDSSNCRDCAFISDCAGCHDCILCTNLASKSFCIRNQQLSKAEYKKQKQQLLTDTHSQYTKNFSEFKELLSKRFVKFAHSISSEDCSGDYIKGTKNAQNCFDVWDSQDLMHVILALGVKDVLHSTCIGGKNTELVYDTQSLVSGYNVRHSVSIFQSKFIEYSDNIFHGEYVFGSVCLQKKKYCILNKQYTESEFKDLRSKVIDHMKSTGEYGQFFPPSLSCFGYNESTAGEIFPLDKEQALSLGFSWQDTIDQHIDAQKVINATDLPDSTSNIPDDILNWAIKCSKTGRIFKVIKKELDFYRSENLPVPRLHPDQRHLERLSMRNPYRLWNRKCAHCQQNIQTSYAPERAETVLCEECYRKEMY